MRARLPQLLFPEALNPRALRPDDERGHERGNGNTTVAALGFAAIYAAGGRVYRAGRADQCGGFAEICVLINEGKFEEAVSVARQQVENGANVIDICMDEGMVDGVAAMTRFLQLLASEPEVAKVPFMVDSSKWGSSKPG